MVTTSKLWKKIVSKTLSSKKKKKYMQVACLDKYYSLSSNPLAKYENRNNDLYVTLFFFFEVIYVTLCGRLNFLVRNKSNK